MKILVMEAQEGVREFLFDPKVTPEVVLGRDDLSCNIVLNGNGISRRHAKIFYRDGNYYFADLNSSNGSLLNGQGIVAMEDYQIQPKDELTVGGMRLVLARSSSEYMPLAHLITAEIPWWQEGEVQVRCLQVIDETAEMKTFRFVTDPPSLFSYHPGQFVALEVEIKGKKVVRPYSISSSPSRPHTLEITVKHTRQGLVSPWLHAHLKPGALLTLRGPLGNFSCVQKPAQQLLFISAGSGITPLLSMTRWLLDTGADCEIIFLHSARTLADIPFREELTSYAARYPKFRLVLTLTGPEPSWTGLKGRIDEKLLSKVPDLRQWSVFLCGPEAFMDSVRNLLMQLNFPMANFHAESFGQTPRKPPVEESIAIQMRVWGLRGILSIPDPSPTAAPTTIAPTLETAPGQVMINFEKSGKELPWEEEKSLLELAQAHGLSLPFGCRMGACGACKVHLKSGQVRMENPKALKEKDRQAGLILTCVAYPLSSVVIDG